MMKTIKDLFALFVNPKKECYEKYTDIVKI